MCKSALKLLIVKEKYFFKKQEDFMIGAGEPTCPAGMVLQKPDGAVHRDEPAFCIGNMR